MKGLPKLLGGDKGTPGQEKCFVPGQRDNGTSHPGLSWDAPSLGNPSTDTRTEIGQLVYRLQMKYLFSRKCKKECTL